MKYLTLTELFMYLILCYQTCFAQIDNCTPSKLAYSKSSIDFKDKALVIDPNNSVAFWKVSKPVNVCWEDVKDYEKFSGERLAVENEIKNTWEKYSLLSFSGWKKCKTNTESGIHINVHNSQPKTQCLGAALNAKKNGMILNFTFDDKWGKAIKKQFTNANNGEFDKLKLIRMLAVHEFGHAIGLAHLQERKDCHFCNEFPDLRNKEDQTNIGVWFMDCSRNYSIMNYSLNDYINNGGLSEYDKDVAGILYGFRNNTKQPRGYKIFSSVKNTNVEAKPTNSVAELKKLRRTDSLVNEINNNENKKKNMVMQSSFSDIFANWHHVILKLTASNENLKKVEYVKYYLYEKMVDDRYNPIAYPKDNFTISFFAWGKFEVKAEVKLKNTEEILTIYNIPDVAPFIYTIPGEKKPRKAGSKGSIPSSILRNQ